MVIYEKIKSRFSRNWWFLISFSGEFVIDMAFGKKSKIFKTRFGISIVSGVSLLLGALPAHLFFIWFDFINWWAVFFIEAGANLLVGCVIQKIFFGKYWVDRYYQGSLFLSLKADFLIFQPIG